MYFPNDMTFQYFFFDTYPGYFLQALPIALCAGTIYAVRRPRKTGSAANAVLPALFVCYITGLLCLTLFEYVMGQAYYFLFYRSASGRSWTWFNFEYDFVPDFFQNFGAENLGNIVMYLPFGIFYPLFRENTAWKQTIVAGIATSLAIELLQPVFGRSFDVNDIILNGTGVILSTAVFYLCRDAKRKKRGFH